MPMEDHDKLRRQHLVSSGRIDDITLARKMQSVMMPHRLPSLEGLELGTLFFPGERGGGNLFDILQISEDVLAFLLFDVTDSSINSGTCLRSTLITAMAKNCFINHIRSGVSPFAVVDRVNHELIELVSVDLQLSVFLGYLDLHDNEFLYCNVGAVTGIVYHRTEQKTETFVCHGKGLGITIDGITGEERLHLLQGDSLVLFTDAFCRLLNDGKCSVEETMQNIFAGQVKQTSDTGFLKRIKEHYTSITSTHQVENDCSVVYAEILTQSRKNQLKVKLGFEIGQIVYLQFLNYLEEMDRTTATILTAMDTAGHQDEQIRKMKIVLTELLVNAIVHGNRKNYKKKVVVGHIVDRKSAIVAILDEGEGFNPASIPDPTLPENIERPCGRGLFIVRHYVDSITFNETGNRVTIIKNNEAI